MKTSREKRMVVLAWTLVLGLCASGQGGIIYVDAAAGGAGDGSSWADAYVYLQDALAVVQGGDEIRVAQGTYKPDQGTDLVPDASPTFHLINGVTLAGGYAGCLGTDPDARHIDRYETILRGEFSEDDLAVTRTVGDSLVVVGSGRVDERVVIEGVTITGGYAENGAAIYASHCSLCVRQCRIVGNRAADRGGAIYFSYSSGELVLEDCLFEGNTVFKEGGGLCHYGGDLFITRCAFVENATSVTSPSRSGVSRGGAICVNLATADTVDIADSLFRGNQSVQGGAIRGDVATLRRCEFIANVASDQGGALDVSGMSVCDHCLFVGNRAFDESAVIEHYGPLTFTHCTFAENWSADGDMIVAYGGHGSSVEVALANCIAWGGVLGIAPGGLRGPDNVSVTYSDFQGGWPGEGNLNVDPDFVLPGTWDTNDTAYDLSDDIWIDGDYHLASQAGHWDRDSASWTLGETTSPCIDAGDPTASMGDEFFPNGGFVNMGAYGGTTEASKSFFGWPLCETHLAGDINGDCKVDATDLLILVGQWTTPLSETAAITIVEPVDGAVLSLGSSDAVHIRAVVSDPDFVPVSVRFNIVCEAPDGTYKGSFSGRSDDEEEGWYCDWYWRSTRLSSIQGDYVITVTATDASGRTEASGPVVVTFEQVAVR